MMTPQTSDPYVRTGGRRVIPLERDHFTSIIFFVMRVEPEVSM
jgi:hypothetical protein